MSDNTTNEKTNRESAGADDRIDGSSVPPILYRAAAWSLCSSIVRVLPKRVCRGACRILGGVCYYLLRRHRRTVIRNLQNVVGDDRTVAAEKARQLFRQFSLKLLDLWFYEAGMPASKLLYNEDQWARLNEAIGRRNGVLLLTPHLGNWELGGALLAVRGVNLVVITQPEPSRNLTEIRRRAREKWGIETLVIRRDPFAFVEIIKRLQDGAVVAMLVDRPPSPSAVEVGRICKLLPIVLDYSEILSSTAMRE
ncbi:MAG: hypothetical protein K9N52_10820 [Verrucomicrobia bacterium]|nr:hypothetical protein [Verrucomicrobiota bacterium]